jgi:hypothetical protein
VVLVLGMIPLPAQGAAEGWLPRGELRRRGLEEKSSRDCRPL